jgi:hypothetical protein
MMIIRIPGTNCALVVQNHRQRLLAYSSRIEQDLRARNRTLRWTWKRFINVTAPEWERRS